MVKWGGIQTILEESLSDVLILLDCCASGTANASEGNGVNELISACAFNETANGVGPYSFTSALVTELRLLSHKPSFSVGELYKKIFFRTQCRMPEELYIDGTHRERHPAPIHLVLSHGESSPRGIQLPASMGPQRLPRKQDPLHSARLGASSSTAYQMFHANDGHHLERGASFSGPVSTDDPPFRGQSRPIYQPIGVESPRLLFSVRLRDSFQPGESMADFFTEWIRNFPSIAEEMRVEATFDSYSTIVIMSLPISVAAYLPQNAAIISLGPVTSENRMRTAASLQTVHEADMLKEMDKVNFNFGMDLSNNQLWDELTSKDQIEDKNILSTPIGSHVDGCPCYSLLTQEQVTHITDPKAFLSTHMAFKVVTLFIRRVLIPPTSVIEALRIRALQQQRCTVGPVVP